MPTQLAHQQPNPTWLQTLVTKLHRAFLALRTPASVPVTMVQLPSGILLDLASNTIVVAGELNIHSTGTMRLSSDQHVILQSGGGLDARGQTEGVWLNPILDENGYPIEVAEQIDVEDENGAE